MSNKNWPEDGSILNFSDLLEPLREAAKEICELKKGVGCKNIPWNGPDEIPVLAAGVAQPFEQLTKAGLKRHKEQDRDAITVLLTVAVQLGIEQGHRLAMQKMKQIPVIRDELKSMDIK